MKIRLLLLSVAALALLAVAGCDSVGASLDLARSGDANRVLSGTLNFHIDAPLPPDTEIVVTLFDTASVEQNRAAASQNLPISTRPQVTLPPTQLGEQTIKGSVTLPTPFHIEFEASDDLLRHGLNVEARVSFSGRVRYRTVNAHTVTLSNIGTQHDLWVTMVAP
jgi:uncharacterized lipoprotein YbaY